MPQAAALLRNRNALSNWEMLDTGALHRMRRERDWSLSHRRLAQGPLPMMLGIVRLDHGEVE
jgi:hypothetical protein